MLRRSILNRLIDYNPETGLVLTECELNLQVSGYMRIQIKGISYRLVNVLWFMLHGKLPEHVQVIQVNTAKLDFRLSNLILDTSKLDRLEEKADKATVRKEKKELKIQALKDKKEMEQRFKDRRLPSDFFDKVCII